MYVAVKGGESAIRNSQQLLAEERRGDRNVEELTLDQIQNQMSLAVDRVMAEGSRTSVPLGKACECAGEGDGASKFTKE